MALDLFPRPGQTRAPHRAVPVQLLRIVREAIVNAWEMIRTNQPQGFNLATAPEDTITTVLHNTLVNRVLYGRTVPGFTPDLFRVSREPKVYSFDASNLDKMPDLLFHLISDRKVAFPDLDGLYAECKPIDTAHAVGGHYCDRGLWRFVCGEYAWPMREAMMIGYAANGYQMPNSLSNALAAGNRPTKMPLSAGPGPIPRTAATTYAQQPHVTGHPRNFQYRGTTQNATDITIHHLWLIRN